MPKVSSIYKNSPPLSGNRVCDLLPLFLLSLLFGTAYVPKSLPLLQTLLS